MTNTTSPTGHTNSYQSGQDLAETTADLEEAIEGMIKMTGPSNVAEAMAEVMDRMAKYLYRIDRRSFEKKDMKRFARRLHKMASDMADAQSFADEGGSIEG